MAYTDRVKQILSWYPSDNPGTLTNLARLLNTGTLAGTGKMVILPVDQGFEHGPARSFAPNPAGYDPDYHSSSPSTRAATPTRRPWASWRPSPASTPGEIPLILKVNNSDSLAKTAEPHVRRHRLGEGRGAPGLRGRGLHHLPGLRGLATSSTRTCAT